MMRPEQVLQQHVTQFLATVLPPPPAGPVWLAPDPGIFASGEHARKIGGIRKSMGVKAGAPDLLFLSRKPFAIELKAGAGKPTPEQLRMHEALEAAGVPVYVARSIPEVEQALREQGVPMRGRVGA